jgi:hypothetical protein
VLPSPTIVLRPQFLFAAEVTRAERAFLSSPESLVKQGQKAINTFFSIKE